jgi:hypothetical protein
LELIELSPSDFLQNTFSYFVPLVFHIDNLDITSNTSHAFQLLEQIQSSKLNTMIILSYKTTFFFAFLVLIQCPILNGQSESIESYICTRPIDELIIDGKLNEESWILAEWTNEFVDIEGDKKPKPLHKTQVKMLWDDNYFYIAAKIYEPHIWATYTKRDAVIYHENDFEVFIDPNGDTHNYYEFEINAIGTHWDLLLTKPYKDGGRYLNSWDIKGLKKGIFIDGTINDPTDIDNYWTVELAFPWAVLDQLAKRTPKVNDQWKVNFSRVNYTMDVGESYKKSINPDSGKEYQFNWVWSPQGVIDMHRPYSWGLVQFSDKPAGSKGLEFNESNDENIKLMLRKVYYAQKKYHKENSAYANDISQLNVEISKEDLNKIDIQTTFSLYEATYTSDQHIWHIMQDGKVWRTKKAR